MKINFRKDSDRQYMIISPGQEKQAFSTYRLRMLTENRINSLLPCRKAEIDCEELLYYDISGLTSLTDYLSSNPIRSDTLQGFLSGLLQLIEKLEDYLLCADNLILVPDYVFVSQKGKRFFFAALPANAGPLCRIAGELSADPLPFRGTDAGVCQREYPPAEGLRQNRLALDHVRSRGEKAAPRNGVPSGKANGL